MSIETIEFKGKIYPLFQSKGNAAKFSRAFANEICKGVGADVGYCEIEWKLPQAKYGIDKGKFTLSDVDGEIKWDNCSATSFPVIPSLEFLHSSHCLEHLEDWVGVLEYWHSKMRKGASLFLYLPDCNDQVYWRNWHNRKHVNYLTPDIMRQYFEDMNEMWRCAFVSGTDLNSSFICIAERV